MKEDHRWIVETSLKAVGLGIAAFGIFEFFDGQRASIERAAQARSLDYISTANSDEHQSAVQTLFEFWLRNPDVAGLLQEQGQTPSGFQAFFVSVLRADQSGNDVVFALRRVAHFHDEVSICVSSKACDREIAQTFFCDDAVQLEECLKNLAC